MHSIRESLVESGLPVQAFEYAPSSEDQVSIVSKAAVIVENEQNDDEDQELQE